jgi:methionine-rich copper-binding protein CopC
MIASRRIAASMSLMVIAWALRPAVADELRVMDSTPMAKAVIDGRTTAFFVRFDRPVDHIHSTLEVTQDGKLIERLPPRLESAPEVLFARAPTLSPGNYNLHWVVRTLSGKEQIQGDIPFSVGAQR